MSTQSGQQSDFGANEWYIQELYQDFLTDPDSVGDTWQEYFADYHPGGAPDVTTQGAAASSNGATQAAAAPVPAPAAVAEPAPAAAPPAASASSPAPAPETAAKAPAVSAVATSSTKPLKGAAALVVTNMEASLEVPTATSVRAVPAKLLADNRTVINNHLRRARGGKVSFTHLIGYALSRPPPTCRS